MRKRIMTIITVAFAAVALMGSTAASAAGTTGGEEPNGDVGTTSWEIDHAKLYTMTGHWKECIDRDDVQGCVMPYGDILWIEDFETDGYGVKLYWNDLDGSRAGVCINNQGDGWGDSQARCNKNLPEDHDIEWYVSWFEGEQWHNSGTKITRV